MTQRTSKLNINSLKANINDIVLVIFEKVLGLFRRIAIVTQFLPNRDSEIRGAIVKIVKTNAILERPVNSLFRVENIYHDNNQTDKASHGEIASPFPLLSCELRIFMKENPIEKKVNSALQQLGTDFQSMIGKEHLNALSLVCIRRDIFLDHGKIIDIYASKYPKRMLLINTLSEN